MGGIGVILLRNWKPIAVGLIILSLCAALIGFGMRYEGLKSDRDAAIALVDGLEETISKRNDDIKVRDDRILILKTANNKQKEELKIYIKLLDKIQVSKNDLETRYNELMEIINDQVIPTTDGSVTEPFIVIPGGVPPEATLSTTSGS